MSCMGCQPQGAQKSNKSQQWSCHFVGGLHSQVKGSHITALITANPGSNKIDHKIGRKLYGDTSQSHKTHKGITNIIESNTKLWQQRFWGQQTFVVCEFYGK